MKTVALIFNVVFLNLRIPTGFLLWTVAALCSAVMFIGPSEAPGQTPKQSKRPTPANAPEWYSNPPSVKDTLLARGKGKSNDEQVAIDKAMVEARASLAHSIDKRWAELLRAIEAEGGTHLERASEPVVLAGSTLRVQKVSRRGRVWTAYVLAGMPEESARNVLMEWLHRNAQWYETVRDTKAVRSFEAPPQ